MDHDIPTRSPFNRYLCSYCSNMRVTMPMVPLPALQSWRISSRQRHKAHPMDFKAPRKLWAPLSNAVPGEFHTYGGHNTRKCLQDRTNFYRSRARQIVQILTLSNSQHMWSQYIPKWTASHCVHLQCWPRALADGKYPELYIWGIRIILQ